MGLFSVWFCFGRQATPECTCPREPKWRLGGRPLLGVRRFGDTFLDGAMGDEQTRVTVDAVRGQQFCDVVPELGDVEVDPSGNEITCEATQACLGSYGHLE